MAATEGRSSRPPFVAVDKALLARTDLSIYDKITYSVIVDAIGKNDCAWTGAGEIARRAGLGRRTVQRSVSVLEELPEDDPHRIYVRRGGVNSGMPNRYSIPDQKRPSGAISLPESSATGTSARPTPRQSGATEKRRSGAGSSAAAAHERDKDPKRPKKKERDLWEEAQSAMTGTDLRTRQFQVAWLRWAADRQERRKPLTRAAVKLQIHKLEGYGHDGALRSIEAAIIGSWAGLFPPDGGNGGRTAPGRATRGGSRERPTPEDRGEFAQSDERPVPEL